MDDETLAAIETSFASEKPKPPLPLFITGNNDQLISTYSSKTAQPNHFLNKPPISIFTCGKENEPPLKKHKIQGTNIATCNQELGFTSANIVTNKRKSESSSSNNETKKLASKTTSTNIKTDKLVSESTFMSSTTSKNPNVKYENCVFHGNITNNFYFSNSETTENNL